jgi:hypothetical protein
MSLTYARKALFSPKLHLRLIHGSGIKHAQRICRFLNTAADQSGDGAAVVAKKDVAPKQKVTIPGRATKEGTEKFIVDSGIQLFHKFNVSNLYVNPIVHGPPRLHPIKLRQKINQRLSDNQLLTAVHRNWSNMIYVYNHYSDSLNPAYWNTMVLPHIMLRKTIKGAPNPHYRPRESLVTVAGLGLVTGYANILDRLKQACETTGLETIDFAIIEVSARQGLQSVLRI